MARNAKLSPGLQVFRGSRPRQDVFAANASTGCCGTAAAADYDKLAERTRFDNALAHSNPTGANDKFSFPFGDGFADTRNNIVNFINEHGVGAKFSVLTIPTYAFVTGVGIHIEAEEPGLTFDLVTRNGLVLPGAGAATTIPVTGAVPGTAGGDAVVGSNPGNTVLPPAGQVLVVTSEVAGNCEITRTATAGTAASFLGFGALNGNAAIDIFGRDGNGQFSLEADEIALRVATMPAATPVVGSFKLTISVSYDIINRAEF